MGKSTDERGKREERHSDHEHPAPPEQIRCAARQQQEAPERDE
jgi:hypothetical protein